MLVFSLLSLLALLPAASLAQGPVFVNSSNPTVLPHAAMNSFATRLYPGCASNKHVVASRTAASQFFQVGGLSGYDSNGNPLWLNSIDYSATASFSLTSTNTFTPAASSFNFVQPNLTASWQATARVSPGMVINLQGSILLMGGKIAGNWALTNDVIMSTNNGQSWTQSTGFAPWGARSDMSVDIEPGTNNVVLCGGEFINFVYDNTCWLSTDGVGAVWKQQAYTFAAGLAFQQAPMTFMYDGAGSTPSTLVMYNPADDNVYRSTDRANSWAVVSSFKSLGFPQQTGRMVADRENNLYMAGGVNENNQIFFSADKGTTWAQMAQITFYPGARIADPVQVSAFTYGCLAINYISAPSVPGSYRKQLIEYGGTLNAAADYNSWLGCSFTTAQQYTSVTNELILPGETVFQALGQGPPNSTQTASLVFHDGASQITTQRWYPSCTANVHAHVKARSSTVQAWQLGGFTTDNNWRYIPTTDYSATGTWTTYQTIANITYASSGSYNGTGQSGKAGSGVAYLNSGRLLVFGGKDSFGLSDSTGDIGVTNDVFISSNNGQSYTYVTGAPGWSPRSDVSVAVNPGSDYVLMGGGQGNPNYANVADFWSTADGGATWQAKATGATQWGPFQDAAMVFMYDNMYAQPSTSAGKMYGTLLLNTGIINPALNQDAVWKSTDGGATFIKLGTAPWTQRIRNLFVADMENNVYMAGGLQATGDVWTSSDFGTSWQLMLQTPTQPGPYTNPMAYQGAQQNCMSLRYFANANSPGGFHKQLTMFGSANYITVGQQNAPECVTSMAVNVLYGEIMYASETSNSNFVDTSIVQPPASTVPSLNLNGPSSLMPQRWYPDCGYDVHAALRGQSAMSYAMGGTDPNYIALPTLDRFSGSSINQFSTIYPVMANGYARSSSSRWAAGVAVLNNGNVLWFGGKSPSFVILNDVWYSADNAATFNQSTVAPWLPRSDMAVAVVPGTNCALIGYGSNYGTLFADLWSSCDGYGAAWTQRSAAGPAPAAADATLVSLYATSGTPDQANPTNTILLYSGGYLYSSANMGANWATGVEAPWPVRTSARLLADMSNNVYMIGGANKDAEQGGNGGFTTQPDAWFSWNGGQNWVLLSQQTTNGYNTPVTLQLADWSCASLNYRGSHRQLVLYSGAINVYNNAQVVPVGAWWNQPTCTCTSQTGIRALLGDLLFPGESANSNNGAGDGLAGTNSGGGGNKFSSGATAGIAVGVGVGVALLCLLGMLFCFGTGVLAGKSGAKTTSGAEGQPRAGNHNKFNDEPSTNVSQVEMNDGGRPAEV